jgi:hypothetical protein
MNATSLALAFAMLSGCAMQPAPSDAASAASPNDAAPDVGEADGGGCPISDDPRACGACIRERCQAFETCGGGTCGCEQSDPLCGQGGFASWPLPAPGERSYRRDGDVVYDDVTLFVWQARTDGIRRTWSDARAHCDALELGGRDDWRLPARMELVSLLDPASVPAIDPLFEATPEYHWTASVPGFDEAFAYVVYFGAAEIGRAAKGSAASLARCVAGSAPATRREVLADRVVDHGTGLVWQREHHDGLTRPEAETYCATLVVGGEGGWRLPSVVELSSIVDEAYGGLDPEVYGSAGRALWTASGEDRLAAWILYPETGIAGPTDPSRALAARCVRAIESNRRR